MAACASVIMLIDMYWEHVCWKNTVQFVPVDNAICALDIMVVDELCFMCIYYSKSIAHDEEIRKLYEKMENLVDSEKLQIKKEVSLKFLWFISY